MFLQIGQYFLILIRLNNNMKIRAKTNETLRVTLAIALIATFLTVLLNINVLIPTSQNILINLFKNLLYAHFAIIASFFFLYILLRARSLKYYKGKEDDKASDFFVVLKYLILFLFNRKALNCSRRELKNKFDKQSKTTYMFFYDEGIRQSFFFPINACIFISINYVANWFSTQLTVVDTLAPIFAFFIVGGAFLFVSFILNVSRYLITNEQ